MRRRVLFVDDDARVLNAHRIALEQHSSQVDAMFAQGAEAALEVVRSASIDVVATDMHMPGMDGTMLLGTIKEDHPELVRIMLCHPSEMEALFAALPVCHQILPKSLDGDSLVNVIERTCRLRELLTDSLRKKIGKVERLPSVPAVYHELMAAMARPDASASRIARIVEKDAAMAAKTLQLVNSAFFSRAKTITKIDQAVAHLGMELIKNLSLTVHVYAAFESGARSSGVAVDAEQEHSLLVARVARRLVPNPRASQNAFTAGLLHDIGNLVLSVCIPEKFKSTVRVGAGTDRPSHEIEAEMLGVTHAEVGAYLLALWGLNYPIVEAVAYHHNPGAALERTFELPTAVSLANALVEEAVSGKAVPIVGHLESLKLIDKLPQWRAIAMAEIKQQNAGIPQAC